MTRVPLLTRSLFLLVVACVAAAACGPSMTPTERLAEENWQLLRKGPDPRVYPVFISQNEAAAHEHGYPEDAKGIEFQLRFIQTTAEAAEAARDPAIAHRALLFIQRIRELDRVGLYEQTLPGFTARFEDAERRITTVLR